MRCGAPERFLLRDPVGERRETFRLGAVVGVAACLALADEAGEAERLQVLRDGGLGNAGGGGQFDDGRLAFPRQTLEDGAAGRIGKSAEDFSDGGLLHRSIP